MSALNVVATVAFFVVLAVVGVQRVRELATARRHTRALVAQGARVVEDDAYALIVGAHVAWFAAGAAEALARPGARIGEWTLPLLAAAALAEGLRRWAIGTLGPRWTTRVVVLPEAPLVARGPYRWMRHPNYAAVSVELAAIPLAFGLVGTAVAVSVLNAFALARRIRAEERALSGAAA